MVATNCQGRYACIADAVKKSLDARHGVHHVDRVDRRIAEIGTVAQRKGVDAAGAVDIADHGGKVSHLARPVPGAGAVGGAPVPWNANQANIHLRKRLMVKVEVRQAHERCQPGKTRHHRAGNRGKKISFHQTRPFQGTSLSSTRRISRSNI